MSKTMKKVVLDLLQKHGLREAFEQAKAGEFHARFENGPYMPLVIEKIADDRVSIAHYGELNGDAMRDPEMTFIFRGDDWLAATFENSYMGTYQEIYVEQGGKEMYYPRLKREMESFAATWANNIRQQGWLRDGVKASSLTHQAILHARQVNPSPAEDAHLEALYDDSVSGVEPEPYVSGVTTSRTKKGHDIANIVEQE